MKDYTEIKEISDTIDLIIEENTTYLEEQVNSELRDYQKQERAKSDQFTEQLKTVKQTLKTLMNDYIKQRRNYLSSKFLTSAGNLFSSNKPKNHVNNSMSINSVSESQSSQTVIKNDNYQSAFTDKDRDQYSMALYEKINNQINAMLDYETTVAATFEIAALLTKENEENSGNLFKTAQKITYELMMLINYSFTLQTLEIPFPLRATDLIASKIEPSNNDNGQQYYIRFLEQLKESGMPCMMMTHKGWPSKFQVYGHNGQEWQITDLDYEAIAPYADTFFGRKDGRMYRNGTHVVAPHKEVYLEILIKNGHKVSGKYNITNLDRLKEAEMAIAIKNFRLEIHEAAESYLKNYFYNEFLPEHPKLALYYRKLEELRLAGYPRNPEILEIKKQAVTAIAVDLSPELQALANNPSATFITKLNAFTDGKFIKLLCEMLQDRFRAPQENNFGLKQ